MPYPYHWVICMSLHKPRPWQHLYATAQWRAIRRQQLADVGQLLCILYGMCTTIGQMSKIGL